MTGSLPEPLPRGELAGRDQLARRTVELAGQEEPVILWQRAIAAEIVPWVGDDGVLIAGSLGIDIPTGHARPYLPPSGQRQEASPARAQALRASLHVHDREYVRARSVRHLVPSGELYRCTGTTHRGTSRSIAAPRNQDPPASSTRTRTRAGGSALASAMTYPRASRLAWPDSMAGSSAAGSRRGLSITPRLGPNRGGPGSIRYSWEVRPPRGTDRRGTGMAA